MTWKKLCILDKYNYATVARTKNCTNATILPAFLIITFLFVILYLISANTVVLLLIYTINLIIQTYRHFDFHLWNFWKPSIKLCYWPIFCFQTCLTWWPFCIFRTFFAMKTTAPPPCRALDSAPTRPTWKNSSRTLTSSAMVSTHLFSSQTPVIRQKKNKFARNTPHFVLFLTLLRFVTFGGVDVLGDLRCLLLVNLRLWRGRFMIVWVIFSRLNNRDNLPNVS